MSLIRNPKKEKKQSIPVDEIRNEIENPGKDEQKSKGALIKKGTVVYKPLPLFNEEESPKKAPQPKAPEKMVQVLKEHAGLQPGQPEEAPVPAEEALAKVKEEAQKTMSRAKAESERVMEEAQNKSKKLIEESKLYCLTAEQNAKREGMAEGKKEGYEAAFQELKQTMEAARDALNQAIQARERLEKSAEQDLAQLAVKIAQRVIGSEVTLNHNVVVNMVKANLERVRERENVIVRVHQDDLETARNNREAFTKFVPEVRSIEIQSDPRVERGGCIVETNLGTVDARISTQLEAIKLAFSQIDERAKKEDSDAGKA